MKNFHDNDMQESAKGFAAEITLNGIDIVYENISYSVQIPDDAVKTKIPCKQKYT